MNLKLVFGIHRVTHRIGLFIQRHIDLTQAEAHILCHLHEYGDSTIAQVHRAFAHKRSTLTGVLDRLVVRGLITRALSSKDRRSFIIGLTRSGQAKAARIHRALEALETEVLRGVSGRAVETFEDIITRIEQTSAEGTLKT